MIKKYTLLFLMILTCSFLSGQVEPCDVVVEISGSGIACDGMKEIIIELTNKELDKDTIYEVTISTNNIDLPPISLSTLNNYRHPTTISPGEYKISKVELEGADCVISFKGEVQVRERDTEENLDILINDGEPVFINKSVPIFIQNIEELLEFKPTGYFITINRDELNPVQFNNISVLPKIVSFPKEGNNSLELKIFDGDCYIKIVKENIEVLPTVNCPDLSFILPNQICQGEELTISNNGTETNLTWEIEFNGGVITSENGNSITYNFLNTGNHSVILKSDNPECIETFSREIEVVSKPSPIIEVEKTTFCSGELIELSSQGNQNGQWLFRKDEDSDIQALSVSSPTYSFTATTSQTGEFGLELANGICKSTIWKPINIQETPSITIQTEQGNSICQGETIIIRDLNQNQQNATYQWIVNKNIQTENSAEYSYTANQLGSFSISAIKFLQNNINCSSEGKLELEVLTVPSPVIEVEKTTFCSGELIELSSQGNQNGKWLFRRDEDSVIQALSVSSPTYSVVATTNQTGEFGLELTNGICSETVWKSFNVQETPILDLEAMENLVCFGNNIEITDRQTNLNANYQWFIDNNVVQGNSTSKISFPANMEGKIQISATKNLNNSICSIDDNSQPAIEITIEKAPEAAIINKDIETTICEGGEISLSGNRVGDWLSPLGQRFSNLQEKKFSPLTTAFNNGYIQFVTFSESKKCTNEDSIKLNIISVAPVNLNSDANESGKSCVGSTITISDEDGSNVNNYSWLVNNNTRTESGPVIELRPDSAGLFTISVTKATEGGCTSDDSQQTISIDVRSIPNPKISIDKESNKFCEEDQLELILDEKYRGYWVYPNIVRGNSTDILSVDTTRLAGLQEEDSGWYRFIAERPGGCSGEDSIQILVNRNPETPILTLAISDDNMVCLNQEIGFQANVVEGNVTINWILDGIELTSTETLDYQHMTPSAGRFSIQAESMKNGCISTLSNAISFTVDEKKSPPIQPVFLLAGNILVSQDNGENVCRQWGTIPLDSPGDIDKFIEIPNETNQAYFVDEIDPSVTYHMVTWFKDDSGQCGEFNKDLCTQISSEPRAQIITSTDFLEKDLFDLQIMPNPNTGRFLLSIDGVSGDYRIDIWDYLGRNLYQEQLRKNRNLYAHSIDLQTYQKGVYLLRVTTEQNVQKVIHFIIK